MAVSRYDVLCVFAASKERGSAIGIRVHGRKNMVITTIDNIVGRDESDTEVRLNDTSIYGETLAESRFSLREIDHICTLRIQFDDPFYVYLRALRSNIRNIREGASAVESRQPAHLRLQNRL